MTEPEIRYCRTSDDVSIAYTTLGDGVPLLFASNVMGDIQWYAHNEPTRLQIDAFAASGCCVVRYDMRGMGASDRDISDLSVGARLLDLEAVADAAGFGSFALCGYTHGNAAAIAYAASHPERVSHLILVNPYATGASYQEKARPARTVAGLRSLAQDDWEFFTLTIASAMVAHNDPQQAQRIAELFRGSVSPAMYLTYTEATLNTDLTELLPAVTAPTLVIIDLGGVGHADLAKAVASRIPGARLTTTTDYVAEAAGFLGLQVRKASGVTSPKICTVLFTDLVGHSEMMTRLGDERGREVLRHHERITRDVLRAHGGDEIKSMGDGFMASFGSVTEAVQCAVALQRAFAGRDGEPLAVRVGLTAGEPIAEDDDLFGATVILASRMAAQAGPGEILIPEPVRHLLAGKMFAFSDRGEFLPKGFDDAVRLYEVRWQ